MPFFSQTGTSSSSLMGREASEMSVSPAQNFSKPPPVPDAPTVILTPGCSSLNSSPAASANGKTVLEPSILMLPESSLPVPPAEPLELLSSSPQAATPSASAAVRHAARRVFDLTKCLLWVLVWFIGFAGSQRSAGSLLPTCGRDVKSV